MYPENSAQSLLGSWWQIDPNKNYKRGRLIQAYVPHVDQIPYELIPKGRVESASHERAFFEIAPLRVNQFSKNPPLPVAALPVNPGEKYAVYRAKRRPLLIISEGGDEIPSHLKLGKPKWQTAPTILAAPYYGITQREKRAGFSPEFIERIKQCEYSHYLWDILPFEKGEESVLRLDHIQPIGRHHDAIHWTPHCLTQDALDLIDSWLNWLFTNTLDTGSIMSDIRSSLLQPALLGITA
jgi:hypothetical protein